MVSENLIEAAKTVESLTGVPPTFPELRKMTRREEREQRDRVKRFLALPVLLQEGVLHYAESIQKAYKGA
jgi:hypothetical protein